MIDAPPAEVVLRDDRVRPGTRALAGGDRHVRPPRSLRHAYVAFWIWVGLYVTTPVLVRELLLAVGAGQSLVALVLLLSPATMIAHRPWMLTPLTAQTLGGWFALPGVTALMMGSAIWVRGRARPPVLALLGLRTTLTAHPRPRGSAMGAGPV